MSDSAHVVLILAVALLGCVGAVALYVRQVGHPEVERALRDISSDLDERPPAPPCPSCERPLTAWPCGDPRHADGWGISGWTWESPFYRSEHVMPPREVPYLNGGSIRHPDPDCRRCGWPIVPGETVVFTSVRAARNGGGPMEPVIEHGVWHSECPRQPAHPRLVVSR